MIWGISCLQFCKKSADHKEGNTCSEVERVGVLYFCLHAVARFHHFHHRILEYIEGTKVYRDKVAP